MSLMNLDSIYLSYSAAPLFDKASLSIEEHERVAVVGRNGSGKSTLLKIMDGVINIDDGEAGAPDFPAGAGSPGPS